MYSLMLLVDGEQEPHLLVRGLLDDVLEEFLNQKSKDYQGHGDFEMAIIYKRER